MTHTNEILDVEDGSIEHEVLRAIDDVSDPHLPLSFVELSMVYDITVTDSVAEITITYPCMGCPAYDMIQQQMIEAATTVDEITDATVEITWNPVWSKDMLDDEARMKLQSSGIAI